MAGLGKKTGLGKGGSGKDGKSADTEKKPEREKQVITKDDAGTISAAELLRPPSEKPQTVRLDLSTTVPPPAETHAVVVVDKPTETDTAATPTLKSTATKPEFQLGEVRCTDKATRALALAGLSKYELLDRHKNFDFGDLPEIDKKMQLRCAQGNSAVRSLYKLELNEAQLTYLWAGARPVEKRPSAAVIRVQTEGDRSVTWLRLEGE